MKTLPHVLAALALLGIAAPALADERSDFEQRYASIRAAMDSRQPDRIKALLAPDFVSIDVHGESQGADALITSLGSLPPKPGTLRSTTVERVEHNSSRITVTQRYHAEMGPAHGGSLHATVFDARSVDVWVKKGSRLLLKSTQVREVRMSRDGKETVHLKAQDA